MDKEKAQALQVTKEIVVKFIEVGRVSPQNFQEFFPAIYEKVRETLRDDAGGPVQGEERD
ncbi:hypothetical protein [Oceanidesulfovibrio marinus]|uniref:Conjugal transfer protein TraB n=1 Tax=Oceanidesulfovibrio marinus TaxID=370038 RepID=A0A6P1ZFE7_9BACT|nr:hypothetical protein [Oceanidesulfovibrio marinus]QJT09306.1 hypothetical protein E8L03_10295 [Oceanidesulfovibrio marinus]TVM32800.1 hypothetical protein DQK91_13910 [Oceanidesulfovibrio marinus]